MKQTLSVLIIIGLFAVRLQAQYSNQLSLEASYNLIEIKYNHDFSFKHLNLGIAAGTGNKGLYFKFNDFYTDIETKIPVFNFNRSEISLNPFGGICLNREAGVLPLLGINMNYSYYFGTEFKHALIFSPGIRYGRKTYLKYFNNQYIETVSQENYYLSLLYFTVGYGFNF